jgi:hypothetical protein
MVATRKAGSPPSLRSARPRGKAAIAAVGLAMWLLAPGAASAKKEPEKSFDWAVNLGLEQGYTDNVRWATDGPDKESAFYTTIEGRVTVEPLSWKWWPGSAALGLRSRIFQGFSERDYVDLYTNLLYEIGHTDAILRFQYSPRRLELEDEPTAGTVHSSEYDLQAGFQRKFFADGRLRLRALFEASWEQSNENQYDDRDSFTPAGVFDARYRVCDLFVPRADLSYGVRNANSANFDRDELEVGGGFDSAFGRYATLTFRYHWLYRDYTVDDPTGSNGTNSNYDRTDKANDFEVHLEIPVPRLAGLTVELRYETRDNNSTKSGRDFNVNQGGIGVHYDFP